MKTFIFINKDTKAIEAVGRVYREDGSLTRALQEREKEIGRDAAILEHAQEICPEHCTARLIDTADLPGGTSMTYDRDFIGAWTDNRPGGKVNIDMEKARNIHMNRIRIMRNKKLQELDIETLKGNDVQAEKQKLRDLPKTYDLSIARTPEELKRQIPEELKE